MNTEDEQLLEACENNNINVARRLLSTGRVDVNYKAELASSRLYGSSALMCACDNGHVEIARMLLEDFRADVNLTNEDGITALMRACREGQLVIARMLLQEFGANAYLKDNIGFTALMFACQYGHINITKVILQEFRGVLDLKDNKGQTAFDKCKPSCKAELENIIAELRDQRPPPQSPSSSPLRGGQSDSTNFQQQLAALEASLAVRTAERDNLLDERDSARLRLARVSEERNIYLLQRNEAIDNLRRMTAERDTLLVRITQVLAQPELQPFRLDKRYLLRQPCTGAAGTLHRHSNGTALFEYARRLCITGGSMYPRQQEVQGFRLVAVDEVVHYPRQVNTFEGRLETLEVLRNGGGLHFNFPTNQFAPDKLAVLATMRDAFHERSAGEPARKVNTLYCFHGPRREHVTSICQTGLVAVSAMDDGYFGSGCYTTLNVEYAVRYAYGDFDKVPRRAPSADGLYPVVMFAAAVGMAYPITPGEDYGHIACTTAGRSDYFGRPLRPGFDLHCVCVSEGNDWQAVTRNYCQYMELVMSQQSDLLPIAVLWFERL